jgi:hypothetical protein
MDWQELAAITIVVLTAGILGYNFIIKRKYNCNCCYGSCNKGCSIVFSIKKGEKPKILTRW